MSRALTSFTPSACPWWKRIATSNPVLRELAVSRARSRSGTVIGAALPRPVLAVRARLPAGARYRRGQGRAGAQADLDETPRVRPAFRGSRPGAEALPGS